MSQMLEKHGLEVAPWWVKAAAGVARRLPAGRYRFMNSLARPAKPFLARLPESAGGYVFECDLRDTIAREACFTGQYEPQETAILRELLRPGDCFADVGANWGYHTLLAAHLVGRTGRVISLEPDPRLFPVLQRNLARNGLTQVKALNLAAAEVTGELQLAGFDEAQGNFGVSRLAAQAAEGPLFTVAARPLDEVLGEQNAAQIDLLKMDIEGAEGVALQGLVGYLRGGRVKRLLLELHPAQLAERGEKAEEVIQFLRGCGYTGWKIAHSRADYRRAAYAKSVAVKDFISPLRDAEPLDDWPHILWLAPQVNF
jgi:FkbM family methyltransferase